MTREFLEQYGAELSGAGDDAGDASGTGGGGRRGSGRRFANLKTPKQSAGRIGHNPAGDQTPLRAYRK